MPPWQRLPFRRFLLKSSNELLDLRDWGRMAWLVARVVLVGHVLNSYVGGISPTAGISMMPTIPHSYRGTPWVLLSRLHQRGRWIKVGDVVTYTNPMVPNEFGCKRVIGMPGDFVSVITPGREEGDAEKVDAEGKWAHMTEQMIRVPEGYCWLAGDNLEWSRDSRLYGPLPLALVKSKVLAVLLPFRDAKWLGSVADIRSSQRNIDGR